MPNRGISFERAYLLFASVYNRHGFSELEPAETARIYWDTQTTRTGNRKLRFRRVGKQQWLLTGAYRCCRSGNTRNRTPEEKSESSRASKLLIPIGERQTNHLESDAIIALMSELSEVAVRQKRPHLRWQAVPDGLKADVLVQQGDTCTPHLWTAIQVKSCTGKQEGLMEFGKTAGYKMPLLCLAVNGDTISERLLFKTELPIDQNWIVIRHGKPSGNPLTESAKTTSDAIYEFLAGIPTSAQCNREYWVYDSAQSSPFTFRGLEVQRFCESLLGCQVESPWEQNTAVDAYINVDKVRIAVSFKTATYKPRGLGSYYFPLKAATNHHEVNVVIVGFRANEHVVSLGIMPASAVNWNLATYCWGNVKKFHGELNITTGVQLRSAVRRILQLGDDPSII